MIRWPDFLGTMVFVEVLGSNWREKRVASIKAAAAAAGGGSNSGSAGDVSRNSETDPFGDLTLDGVGGGSALNSGEDGSTDGGHQGGDAGAHTGGGGGGCAESAEHSNYNQVGGDGGSGIVIVREHLA